MKKLILIPFLALLFLACNSEADKAVRLAEEFSRTIENSIIKSDDVTIVDAGRYSGYNEGRDSMSVKEGYEKAYAYDVAYDVKGQQYSEVYPHSYFSVEVYKKDNKIAFFIFNRSSDDRQDVVGTQLGGCEVYVNETSMTSEDCGKKEGEDVTKILNAINHMAYFDY